jgi:hypothetical protein
MNENEQNRRDIDKNTEGIAEAKEEAAKADIRSAKTEDRIDSLETEGAADVYKESRTGQGGQEDRIVVLETADSIRLRGITSLRSLWRDLVPFLALAAALVAIMVAVGKDGSSDTVRYACKPVVTVQTTEQLERDGTEIVCKEV